MTSPFISELQKKALDIKVALAIRLVDSKRRGLGVPQISPMELFGDLPQFVSERMKDDPGAWEELIQALATGDDDLRLAAAMGLAASSDPRAAEALTAALDQPDPNIRCMAIMGLTWRPSAEVTTTLAAALRDPAFVVQRLCAMALRIRGAADRQAFEYLLARLQTGDSAVRKQAVELLVHMTGQRFVFGAADPDKWLRWWAKQPARAGATT